MMPVRCWIHSSEESIGPTRSSFGTTRSPRAAPQRVDAGELGPVRLLQGGCRHARLSRVVSAVAQALCSMSSMAAGRSSGVFTATVGHALEPALRETDERAGGRELDDAGDPGRLRRTPCRDPSAPAMRPGRRAGRGMRCRMRRCCRRGSSRCVDAGVGGARASRPRRRDVRRRAACSACGTRRRPAAG